MEEGCRKTLRRTEVGRLHIYSIYTRIVLVDYLIVLLPKIVTKTSCQIKPLPCQLATVNKC